MNRSYSKIRHIQESNQRLEKRLFNEQSNSLLVSDSYTAEDCDELHAFESTKRTINGQVVTVTVGGMNTKVANKINEWNSKGINVKPISVDVRVNGMTVSWTVTFEKSDVNWVGFTSRGAGCNDNVDYRAGNDAINNGPKSVVDRLKTKNKTVGKIEIVNDFKYNGGNNTFKQVFYRYTLITETAKPTSQPTSGGRVIEKEIKFLTTNLDTLNNDFKENVNTYIKSEGNKNYNIMDNLFSVSSKNGVTINVLGHLYLDENGYNKFSILLNEKGNPQESLNNALSKNPGSKLIKDGTITINKIEYEYHLIGLHVV